jgi:hypothetical protein
MLARLRAAEEVALIFWSSLANHAIPKVAFISRIQNPDFGPLRRSLPFVGLSLSEISDGGYWQPDELIERWARRDYVESGRVGKN